MRSFLTIVVPLALPTLLYFLYVAAVRRRNTMAGTASQPIEVPWSWLIIAGGLLVAITFAAYTLFGGSDGRGPYHPAQRIDGKIQPGYFEDAPE
jgi:hypothetical protein